MKVTCRTGIVTAITAFKDVNPIFHNIFTSVLSLSKDGYLTIAHFDRLTCACGIPSVPDGTGWRGQCGGRFCKDDRYEFLEE